MAALDTEVNQEEESFDLNTYETVEVLPPPPPEDVQPEQDEAEIGNSILVSVVLNQKHGCRLNILCLSNNLLPIPCFVVFVLKLKKKICFPFFSFI